MNLKRKVERNKEKIKQKEIRETYGKKPKSICPKCHKHSIFMTNQNGEVYCIRCDRLVALDKNKK